MIRSKHRQDLRGSHDHFICCLYICLGGPSPLWVSVPCRARCGPVSYYYEGDSTNRVFAKEKDKQDVHSGYLLSHTFSSRSKSSAPVSRK